MRSKEFPQDSEFSGLFAGYHRVLISLSNDFKTDLESILII